MTGINMTSSMRDGKDNVMSALDRAEASGISIEPGASGFSEKLLSWIEAPSENMALVRQLVSALERTLNRSHDDARLVLSLCLSIQEFSGLAMPDLLKKIEKAIKFLDKPAPATVVRTIKNSAAAALHPKVIELHDLDAITALSKAPQDSISPVAGETEVLRVGSEEINLATSGKREIEAAVRKVKAEAKKSSGGERKKASVKKEAPVAEEQTIESLAPAQAVESSEESDTHFDEEELAFPEELHSELDEAALALSKLLRSMPRKGKLSNLALVIEEAKKLLEFTRRDLMFSQQQGEPADQLYGDFN